MLSSHAYAATCLLALRSQHFSENVVTLIFLVILPWPSFLLYFSLCCSVYMILLNLEQPYMGDDAHSTSGFLSEFFQELLYIAILLPEFTRNLTQFMLLRLLLCISYMHPFLLYNQRVITNMILLSNTYIPTLQSI